MIPGRFNDGKTARSRPVTVTIAATGLDIRGEDGLLVAWWKREDLRRLDGPGLRLGCAADPDARLTVDDPRPFHTLLPERRTAWGQGVALAAAGMAVLAGLWFALPLAAEALVGLVPVEAERRWGDVLADGLERQWGACGQPAGLAALALLSDRVAAGLPPGQRPRKVAVVRLAVTNAIALPGGRVIVMRGLLEDATGADEVAGVLAHEFVHVAERHAAAATIRALGVSALVTLVTGDSSGLLAGGATLMLAGSYSREVEAEADRGAVELLNRAGLDGSGLAAFFRRIARDGAALPAWLGTHPDPLARAQAVEQAARPAVNPPLTAAQWAALKDVCGQ